MTTKYRLPFTGEEISEKLRKIDELNKNKSDVNHTHNEYLTEHQDISSKQDKTDDSLDTKSKTIVGAINELSNIVKFVTPSMYKESDKDNDTTILQRCLDDAYDKNCCVILDRDYYIAKPTDDNVMLRTKVSIYGDGYCLVANSQEAIKSGSVYLPTTMIYIENKVNNIVIDGIEFKCPKADKKGYHDLDNIGKTGMEDITGEVIYTNLCAIQTTPYSTNSTKAENIKIRNCIFRGTSIRFQNVKNSQLANLKFVNCDEEIFGIHLENVEINNIDVNVYKAQITQDEKTVYRDRSRLYHVFYIYYANNIRINNVSVNGSSFLSDIFHFSHVNEETTENESYRHSKNITVDKFVINSKIEKLLQTRYTDNVIIKNGYIKECNYICTYGIENTTLKIIDCDFNIKTDENTAVIYVNKNKVENTDNYIVELTDDMYILFDRCKFEFSSEDGKSVPYSLFKNYNTHLNNCKIINKDNDIKMNLAEDKRANGFFMINNCEIISPEITILRGDAGGRFTCKNSVIKNTKDTTSLLALGEQSYCELYNCYIYAIKGINLGGSSKSYYNNVIGYYFENGTTQKSIYTWSSLTAKQ